MIQGRIISCLDVETYADSDGDGVGVFKGPAQLLRDDSYQPFAEPGGKMTIGPYKYRWFRIGGNY